MKLLACMRNKHEQHHLLTSCPGMFHNTHLVVFTPAVFLQDKFVVQVQALVTLEQQSKQVVLCRLLVPTEDALGAGQPPPSGEITLLVLHCDCSASQAAFSLPQVILCIVSAADSTLHSGPVYMMFCEVRSMSLHCLVDIR